MSIGQHTTWILVRHADVDDLSATREAVTDPQDARRALHFTSWDAAEAYRRKACPLREDWWIVRVAA